MPKETISPNPGTALIFKWGKERSDGQVGVEFGDNFFSFSKDLNSRVEVGSVRASVPEYNSLWVNFESRSEINRAIRILRKMRDDMFGRDE